jgi:uncharacterized phage protein (TIGR01671 family)
LNIIEPDRLRFRAWDKHYKEMWHNIVVDAGPIDEETGEVYAGEIHLYGCPSHGVHLGGHYARPLDCVEIMQSTGCADHNGKEIFEGDIIKLVKDTNICNGKYGVVVWALGSWMVEDNERALDMPVFSNSPNFEVVRNIYENPKLRYE